MEEDEKLSLLVTTAHAQAGVSLAHAILEELFLKGLVSEADMIRIYHRAADLQQVQYNQHGVAAQENELAARILEGIASEIAKAAKNKKGE